MTKNLKFNRVPKDDDEWVQKIDDDSYFDAIKTNMKTLTELKANMTTNLVKKYIQFYKEAKKLKLTGIKNDNGESIIWIDKQWRKLKEWIDEHYTNDGSSEIMNLALANLLLSINKTTNRENVRVMFIDGKKSHAKATKITEDNKLRPNEVKNWVCYEDIEQMREKYLKMFEVNPTLTNNMRSISLSLLTLVPPIRLNYHDMIVHRKKTAPPQGMHNYIWEYEKGKWRYVIGNDKITYKEMLKDGYKRAIFTLSDEIEGITDGKRLNEIITNSLDIHKRKYLLTPTRLLDLDKPMTESAYNSMLATIFQPKRPTCNIFRKAYVNYYYPKLSTTMQREIATRMRHNKNTAHVNYMKLNIPSECKPKKIIKDVDIKLDEEDLPAKPVKEPMVKKSYFNAKEHAKEYRVNNKEKIAEQRKKHYEENKDKILKNKILWMLNISQSIDKPSKASVEKYDIKYNNNLKKWE